MLGSLSSLQKTIHASNVNTIPTFARELCTLILKHLSLPPSDADASTFAIMVAGVTCLHQWISGAPWIMRLRDVTSVVMKIISIGITNRLSREVNDACTLLMGHVIYHAGLHPVPYSPQLPELPSFGASDTSSDMTTNGATASLESIAFSPAASLSPYAVEYSDNAIVEYLKSQGVTCCLTAYTSANDVCMIVMAHR
jgi:hypothetical protein